MSETFSSFQEKYNNWQQNINYMILQFFCFNLREREKKKGEVEREKMDIGRKGREGKWEKIQVIMKIYE